MVRDAGTTEASLIDWPLLSMWCAVVTIFEAWLSPSFPAILFNLTDLIYSSHIG